MIRSPTSTGTGCRLPVPPSAPGPRATKLPPGFSRFWRRKSNTNPASTRGRRCRTCSASPGAESPCMPASCRGIRPPTAASAALRVLGKTVFHHRQGRHRGDHKEALGAVEFEEARLDPPRVECRSRFPSRSRPRREADLGSGPQSERTRQLSPQRCRPDPLRLSQWRSHRTNPRRDPRPQIPIPSECFLMLEGTEPGVNSIVPGKPVRPWAILSLDEGSTPVVVEEFRSRLFIPPDFAQNPLRTRDTGHDPAHHAETPPRPRRPPLRTSPS